MSDNGTPEEMLMAEADSEQQQSIIDGVKQLDPVDYAADERFPWIS